jgi:hypothetical protein
VREQQGRSGAQEIPRLGWLRNLTSLAGKVTRTTSKWFGQVGLARSLVVFFAAHPSEGDVRVSEGIVPPGHDHPVTLP